MNPENRENELEDSMEGERFYDIYSVLKGKGISDEEIATFCKNYEKGMGFIRAKGAQQKEGVEFMEELMSRVADMTDKELAEHSKRYYGENTINPSDKFQQELLKRNRKRK